jgi:hypothetical protein
MSTVVSTTLSRLLDPGLRRIFSDEAAMVADEYTMFNNVETLTEPYFTDYDMAFLGLVPQIFEGQAVTYDSPIPGNTKRYDPLEYALGFRSTHKAVRDERYGQLKKMSKHLGRSVKQTINLIGASAYNNAFSTSFTGFRSGESLCSTTHVLLGGGSYANRPSTDATLGVAALQAAVIRMEKTVSERGFQTPMSPKLLVIPTDLRFVAKEVLRTPNVPYSADNTINAIKDEGISFREWHFLTSTTAWFLLASDHDINMFWREKPTFASGDDFDTGDAKHKVYMSLSTPSFGSWRGIDGTDGTP